MKLTELPDWIESEFEFPITQSALLERAGDTKIEAPDTSDSETLATILTRGGEEEYESADDLLDSIRANLSDEYIGRKYYDDRGNNPAENEDTPPEDSEDESF